MLPNHEKLLESLRVCRSEAIAAKRLYRTRSGMARCIAALVDEIDAVAELVTGKVDYFHDKGSAPSTS
jgi:hypothetical protein